MQELSKFLTSHPLLSGGILVIFILLTIVEIIRAKRKAVELTPQAATQKINRENAVIIDIRPSDAFKSGHIIDATLLAPDAIRNNPKLLNKFKTKPLIFVCANGVESQKTAAFWLKSGYNAYSLKGGMRAWGETQLPVVKD